MSLRQAKGLAWAGQAQRLKIKFGRDILAQPRFKLPHGSLIWLAQ
jgi:hypothetical protein